MYFNLLSNKKGISVKKWENREGKRMHIIVRTIGCGKRKDLSGLHLTFALFRDSLMNKRRSCSSPTAGLGRCPF